MFNLNFCNEISNKNHPVFCLKPLLIEHLLDEVDEQTKHWVNSAIFHCEITLISKLYNKKEYFMVIIKYAKFMFQVKERDVNWN